VDNPDQRISQDVDTFTKMTLEYLVGTIDSLVMFSMNILVLWSISPTMTTVLLSWSIGMTALILFLSKFLVRVNYVQLKLEADFRYSLVHVRNNAESIAFYSGESPERSEMSGRLNTLVENYNKLIKWTVGISVVDKLYNYGNEFVPYVLMGQQVLLGTLTFGQFSQATFTFRLVQNALSFIAQSINAPGGSNTMTQWVAGISRLEGFQAAVEQVSVNGEGAREFHVSRQGADIVVRGAELRTPGTGQLVVSGLNLSLKRSERLLIVGPSGCGKTSLLRMICGLWQPAAGQLEAPPVGEMLFVPQKPYMVLGSLREQLSYPQGEGAFSDDQMRQALQEVCLGHFVERYPDLAVKQDWARLMSLGEQQRLSFARVLLNAPSFVVLDEASSGLDVATERKLYSLLVQRGTGFMSVGHRPTLKSFHTGVLELKGAPTGGWQLLPADSYEFSA
jgi:putative ATP-binding cassette transporter